MVSLRLKPLCSLMCSLTDGTEPSQTAFVYIIGISIVSYGLKADLRGDPLMLFAVSEKSRACSKRYLEVRPRYSESRRTRARTNNPSSPHVRTRASCGRRSRHCCRCIYADLSASSIEYLRYVDGSGITDCTPQSPLIPIIFLHMKVSATQCHLLGPTSRNKRRALPIQRIMIP